MEIEENFWEIEMNFQFLNGFRFNLAFKNFV